MTAQHTALYALSLAASARRLALFNACGLPAAVSHASSALSVFAHARLATPLFKTGLVLITCCDATQAGQYALYVLSLCGERRAIIAVPTASRLDSISALYASAGWYEREASELFGLTLSGSDDTRGLLLAYNSCCAPLRKSASTATRGLLQSSRAAASLR